MASGAKRRGHLVSTWRTAARVTSYLAENLPEEVWDLKIPGAPRRTVRMILGHLHNCRVMWVKTLGERYGVEPPESVDRHRVEADELRPARAESEAALEALLEAALEEGENLVGFSGGVVDFLAYHAAHEGHHRGQIVMVARAAGHRLPREVTNGLWQWSKRRKEARR
ncbi:MAG: DinB family protein [Thermoanaerobaculia bacterium]|nr:DinB family protein [Thermoanaerobaculia bacterium]